MICRIFTIFHCRCASNILKFECGGGILIIIISLLAIAVVILQVFFVIVLFLC